MAKKPVNTTPTLDIHPEMHANNVRAYGAGNNVDDTAAFQEAIDNNYEVTVPPHPTGGNYILKNKLTVTNTAGLHLVGEFNKGYGPTILCNSFPNTTTDLFDLTVSGFPQLHLENLFFVNNTGNKPRDLFRQTIADNQGCYWRNIWVENFGGYGCNIPAGMEIVAPRFENCHFVFCGAGGMYFAGITAGAIDNCRFAGNGGTADLEIIAGAGITITHPVFDGFAPGAANFSRLKTSALGVTVIQPYVEWTTASASGTLRNIYVNGGGTVTIIGGVGQVTPASFTGGGSLTPVELANTSNITLVGVPTSGWNTASPYDLKIINASGVVGFIDSPASKISVDAGSQPYTTLYSAGRLLRFGQNISAGNLTGATPDSGGARVANLNNGGATNMTNLTDVQEGHIITLNALNGNTTIMDGANGNPGTFHLRASTNYNLPNNCSITFVARGNVWYEIARTD